MTKAEDDFKKSVETLATLTVLEEKIHYQSKLEPFNSYASRLRQQIIKQHQDSFDFMTLGCKVVFEELAKILSPEQLKAYAMKIPEISDENLTEQREAELQDSPFGYTDQMCQAIFDIAIHLQEQRQYERSAAALGFLLLHKPVAPGVWIALGNAWKECHKDKEALEAYLMAIECDPFSLEPYQYAAQFCLDHNKSDEALKAIDFGLELASSQDIHEKEFDTFKNNLKEIRSYVEFKSK